MNTKRMNALIQPMKKEKLYQMLITDPSSIFYLLNIEIDPGERCLALYIHQDGNMKLFLNDLFYVPADIGIKKVWYNDTDNPITLLSQEIDGNEILGIEKTWSAKFLLALMEENKGIHCRNTSYIIDALRMIKDEQEIKKMIEVSKINDMAMKEIISCVKEGITEKQLVRELEEIYVRLGADGFSFHPIVAFGKNGADTHHKPDHTVLQIGDSIIFDIGCIKDHYCADMTRTVFFKEVSQKQREVYEIVKQANINGEQAALVGHRFCDVDKAARDTIETKGYGQYFTHRTGHSIGIDVHEYGDVSLVNQQPLQSGMIFSVEPGIYLDQEFGVRIEDLVLVTDDKPIILNQFSKELIVIQ